jgi:hypothetical protein
VSSKEAGQLCALLAALSTCISVMHAWCMPCTQSVDRPEIPARTLCQVRNDLKGHHCRWGEWLWCRPILLSACVPSNAYICKRLAGDHAAMKQSRGTSSHTSKAQNSIWHDGHVRVL